MTLSVRKSRLAITVKKDKKFYYLTIEMWKMFKNNILTHTVSFESLGWLGRESKPQSTGHIADALLAESQCRSVIYINK